LIEVTLFRRKAVAVFVEEEALLVELPEAQKCLRLTGTARRIWEFMEYPITLEELVQELIGEFAGDQNEIAARSERFLENLKTRGLVETAEDVRTLAASHRQRYLWLLKRALVNLIYPEHELRIKFLENAPPVGESNKLEQQRFLRDIRYRQPDRFAAMVAAKENGTETSLRFPHTMIGLSGLDNLERCAEQIFADRIPGDFLEAGVCAGGAAVFLRAMQMAFGESSRRVWVVDSFQGLPPPKAEPDVANKMDLTEARAPWVCFSLEGVRDNFARYGLLDDQVRFLPGWFSDTLPEAPIEKLALLRIDADLYQSTREVLDALYDKVAAGGFVIVDDYGAFAPCRQAVDEFRAERGITGALRRVDRHRVFWRKRI
jgi:Macrocin-O-methyltransferase (TylF)/Coenzyme PQQ synthesis protein D (PqqD)